MFSEITVGLGRRGERAPGEDVLRVADDRDRGKHRRIQAPLQIRAVAHPVIEVIADVGGRDAQEQPQDRANRQQNPQVDARRRGGQ